MAIPKYNELYPYVLKILYDQQEHTKKELYRSILETLDLSDEDIDATIPSGEPKLLNRTGWSLTYLKKAGLVMNTSRGVYKITPRGKELFETEPVIDNQLLSQFESFRDYIGQHNEPVVQQQQTENECQEDYSGDTPQEILDKAYQEINSALAEDLLSEIMKQDSVFFERLVVKLLLKMGYGGTFDDAAQVTKPSHDGGIDGIIKEDKLGFSQIYIQAKRWDMDTTISRPEIQKFSGALQELGANKGLFITTARFSSGAIESAKRQHIVLVDGQTLAKLMIEYDLGVSTTVSYHLKSLDTDFFNDDL